MHGIDYVAWPRLRPLTETINYSGKGHFSGRRGRGFAASGGGQIGGKNKQLAVQTHSDKVEKDMETGHTAALPGKKRVD